ncbi:MAG: zf-HC2 domain-containing protein [Candidatus Krumholzibacteriia bacterium]
MNGHHQPPEQEISCQDCTELLQDYLDGTLAKPTSLALFLHVRQCPACERELESWRVLMRTLDDLPRHDVPEPASFDRAVMERVPLQAYRAMEPLRRDRIPVFLEDEFLPGFVRSPAVRTGGLAVAAAGAMGLALGLGVAPVETAALAGVLPELMVRLQRVGRRLALRTRRSEA